MGDANIVPASEIKSFGKFQQDRRKEQLIRKGYCCQCGEWCSNRTLMSDKDAAQMIEAVTKASERFPTYQQPCLQTLNI